MNYTDFSQPPALPAHLLAFDPEAGDCTCVNPVAMNHPPLALAGCLRQRLQVDAGETAAEREHRCVCPA